MPGRVRRAAGRLRSLLAIPATLDVLHQQLLEARHQLLELRLHLDDAREQLLVTRHELVTFDADDRSDRTLAYQHALELGHRLGLLTIRIDEIEATLRRHSRSAPALAEMLDHVGAQLEGPPPDGPLVSILLPVRDRAATIEPAVRSVLEQTSSDWELLIIDDGSVDRSAEIARQILDDDERVTVLRTDGVGAAAARNHGLDEARGEVVAYLDSDNRLLPTYVAHLQRAFADPGVEATVSGQLVVDDRTGEWWIRDDDRPPGDLEHANSIDLNALAHRRSLVESVGRFDDDLLRLSDWDLVQRIAAHTTIRRLPIVGSLYRFGAPDQISVTEPYGWYHHLVTERYQDRSTAGPRVLAADWHYPQLSESYLEADLQGLVAGGAHVEVWSEEAETAAPYPSSLRVHRGTLAEALDAVDPDIVLTHWLGIGQRVAEALGPSPVPLAVRGHGFEFSPAAVRDLLERDQVARVYLFPHLLERLEVTDARLRPLPVAFDAGRFTPARAGEVDRRLVVRAGVALPTKDYATFFSVAASCPDHRFVLCLVPAHTKEHHLDEIIAERDACEAPVDIRISVERDEMADLLGRAGIYLHTHTGQEPYGMPVSIAEAMATGCYVLVPEVPGSDELLGEAGDRYRSPEDAARLIRATTRWTPARWHAVSTRAIDRAFRSYTHRAIGATLLDDWRRAGLVPSQPR